MTEGRGQGARKERMRGRRWRSRGCGGGGGGGGGGEEGTRVGPRTGASEPRSLIPPDLPTLGNDREPRPFSYSRLNHHSFFSLSHTHTHKHTHPTSLQMTWSLSKLYPSLSSTVTRSVTHFLIQVFLGGSQDLPLTSLNACPCSPPLPKAMLSSSLIFQKGNSAPVSGPLHVLIY